MVQLQVGGGACCLIHCSYNVRALGIFCVQEAVEHFSKRSCMMEIVQNDHRGKVQCIIFTLLCYVGKILTQLFAAFMVHTETQYGDNNFNCKAYSSATVTLVVLATVSVPTYYNKCSMLLFS